MSIKSELPLQIIRWTARILGAGLLLLVLVFAVAEGVPNPLRLTFHEKLAMSGLLSILIGIAVAFKREGLGGGIILAGFVWFWGHDIAMIGYFRINSVFLLFALTGVLFVESWRRSQGLALKP